MASTDLTTIEPGSFLALNHSTGEIQAIIGDNLAGQDVGEFDLPRITMPAGGGTRWEIPGLAGAESSETLSGILVYTRQTRAYWPSKDATGDPPQCSSRDGQVGVGDPGGECRTCPNAQFGSDGQRGQACKQQSQWFLLRSDSFLPVVLGLPPTSLKAAKQYMLALAGAGIRYFEVVTDIGLDADKNADGQKYSRAVPRLGGRLDPETTSRAREYAEILRPIFDAQPAADAAVRPAASTANGDPDPPAAPAASQSSQATTLGV